jgi:hypothetical protein
MHLSMVLSVISMVSLPASFFKLHNQTITTYDEAFDFTIAPSYIYQ